MTGAVPVKETAATASEGSRGIWHVLCDICVDHRTVEGTAGLDVSISLYFIKVPDR